MFANVGWGEMLVLVIAGLVILGPERLPGAIRWTGGAVRQVRDYVTGATTNSATSSAPTSTICGSRSRNCRSCAV